MHSARLKVGINPGDLASELFLQQIAHDSQTSRTGAHDNRRALLGWAHGERCSGMWVRKEIDFQVISRDIKDIRLSPGA